MNKMTIGWINGVIGMLIFSASLPATRAAVQGFSPSFVTSGRAVLAAILACVVLLAFRQTLPDRKYFTSLVIVSGGVVVGFPLFTGLALEHITSAHSLVFIGLLPLSTALFGVLRAGERPHPAFWVFAISGSGLIAAFALSQGGRASLIGDTYMLIAIVVCGLGYAEGGKLAKSMGGWQVISWALVLALPLMVALAVWSFPDSFDGIENSAWTGFLYVSFFSMFIGFIFWYRGLAQGGIAAVGQLQLLQPFFGLALAAGLLGEPVGWKILLVTIAVAVCVAGARRFSRVR